MHVRTLSLRNFRLYSRLELDLPAAPILLLGANAQGKTSLLEAIACLALGRSPLTATEQHLIHWGAIEAGMPFAHIQAEVVKKNRVEQLEIAMERSSMAGGHTRLDKRLRVDRRAVRRADLAGHLNVVLFLPEDVGLVGGPPAGRRRYLDDLLSQVYPDYIQQLGTYQEALLRRNALLKHLREDGGDPSQLDPLEFQLSQYGVGVSFYRQRLIHALTHYADRLHRELTGGAAWLQLQYQPNFDLLRPPAMNVQLGLMPELAPESFPDVKELQAAYLKTLQRQRSQEIRQGTTLLGPHRDELRFTSEGVDLGIFGSRGQQRTAVLALRLAELRWLQEVTGEAPVLLLDEVLAELDLARRGYLLKQISGVEQTILATTDAEMFPAEFRQQALALEVQGGIVGPKQ